MNAKPWAQLTEQERAQVRYEMGSCVDWMSEWYWRLCEYPNSTETYWNCEFPPKENS